MGYLKDAGIYKQESEEGKKVGHKVHSETNVPQWNHTEKLAKESIQGVPASMGDTQGKSGGREFPAVSQIDGWAVRAQVHGKNSYDHSRWNEESGMVRAHP